MSNQNITEQKEPYLTRLSNLPLDILRELDILSSAPISTLRMLAAHFKQAVLLGFAHIIDTNQIKAWSGCGTAYELIKNNPHTKFMTTIIDRYGDGTTAVTESDFGLNPDPTTVEGLYRHTWSAHIDARITDARNSTSTERLKTNAILERAGFEDSPATAVFETLCLRYAYGKTGNNN